MKRSNKGFTMIELVIVLVLIGILGVALVPSMKMVYKQELRKSADILCGDLMMMRKQAIATNVDYTLSIDSTNKEQYTITPNIIQATAAGRGGNSQDDISPNISYTIVMTNSKCEDTSTYGSDATIWYKGGKLVDPTGGTAKVVDYLTIRVDYDGTDEFAEIIYEGFTGRYSINIKK